VLSSPHKNHENKSFVYKNPLNNTDACFRKLHHQETIGDKKKGNYMLITLYRFVCMERGAALSYNMSLLDVGYFFQG